MYSLLEKSQFPVGYNMFAGGEHFFLWISLEMSKRRRTMAAKRPKRSSLTETAGRKIVGKLMATCKEIGLESGLSVEIRMEKGSLNASSRIFFPDSIFQSFFQCHPKNPPPKGRRQALRPLYDVFFFLSGRLRSDSLSMFRREVDLLRSLKHPSLWRETSRVRIHDGPTGGK